MKHDAWSRRQVEVVAGLSAGFSTTIVTHPLDVIKIRLQLLPSKGSSRFSSLRQVVSSIHESANEQFKISRTNRHRDNGSRSGFNGHESIGANGKEFGYERSNGKQFNGKELGEFKGIKGSNGSNRSIGSKFPFVLKEYYRGLTPNLVGNIAAWSLYFTLYAEFKNLLPADQTTANYFAASTCAGVSTSLLTNPLWVLKTRILGTSKHAANAYRSVWDGVRQIYANEGVLSFWKGTIPSLFSVFQGSLQFTIYDHLKSWLQVKNDTPLPTHQYIYASAVSKVLSMTVMYPSQVVKARLQNYNLTNEPRNIRLICRDIWLREGAYRGFYKGISANIVRVLPATCITFVVYESTKNFLSA